MWALRMSTVRVRLGLSSCVVAFIKFTVNLWIMLSVGAELFIARQPHSRVLCKLHTLHAHSQRASCSLTVQSLLAFAAQSGGLWFGLWSLREIFIDRFDVDRLHVLHLLDFIGATHAVMWLPLVQSNRHYLLIHFHICTYVCVMKDCEMFCTKSAGWTNWVTIYLVDWLIDRLGGVWQA